MPEQTQLRRLLVLRGPSLESQGILDFLKGHFDIRVATDLDGALAAMREQRFDAVLAETSDFLPLERGVVTQQAGVVLDTIGDGVCVVGPQGELVWANRQFRNFAEVVKEPLRQVCVQAYGEFAAGAGKDPDRGRRYSIMPPDGAYYEVICSPVRDRQGGLRQVIAVVVNATSQRRLQLKLNAIDKAGRRLVSLDDEMLKQKDASQRLALLEDRIIHCIHDFLQYRHFAVLLLDRRTNRLESVITEGFDEEAAKYELFASPEGNGICGYVAATGRSYICPGSPGIPATCAASARPAAERSGCTTGWWGC